MESKKPDQYFYGKTSKIPIGGAFYSTGRYPLESYKEWNKLKDLQDFIVYNGSDASAYPGMIVSVVNDGENNGVYVINKVGNDALKNNIFDETSYDKLVSSENLSTNVEDINEKMSIIESGLPVVIECTLSEYKEIKKNGNINSKAYYMITNIDADYEGLDI